MFTKIRSEVASQMKTGQRRFYLRQQLRAIQKELGEEEGEEANALEELEARLAAAPLPPPAEKVSHEGDRPVEVWCMPRLRGLTASTANADGEQGTPTPEAHEHSVARIRTCQWSSDSSPMHRLTPCRSLGASLQSMVVTYLEWLADLPWGRTSGVTVGPTQAKVRTPTGVVGIASSVHSIP